MIKIYVIRPIRLPAGATLNGAACTAPTWASKGWHTVDAVTFAANDWEARGFVESVEIDGAPVMWSACCADHNKLPSFN